MKLARWITVLSLIAGATHVAMAQTATQTVTFAVNAVNRISVSGPASLTINSATAGSQPDDAISSGLTWAVTTNGSNMKVTGSLASAMPAGVTLSADLAAPSSGSSAGYVSLGTSAADLVTGMTKVAQSGMSLALKLSTTVSAGTVSSTTNTITYTVLQGP